MIDADKYRQQQQFNAEVMLDAMQRMRGTSNERVTACIATAMMVFLRDNYDKRGLIKWVSEALKDLPAKDELERFFNNVRSHDR